MLIHEVTRWFEIDAGHRILNHESKCRNLHGHRYRIGFTLRATDLDPLGRVRDFGIMKDVYGTWLEANWDHAMILCMDDPQIKHITNENLKIFITPDNPTAENMARWLYGYFTAYPDSQLVRVTVFETPNCSATYPAE